MLIAHFVEVLSNFQMSGMWKVSTPSLGPASRYMINFGPFILGIKMAQSRYINWNWNFLIIILILSISFDQSFYTEMEKMENFPISSFIPLPLKPSRPLQSSKQTFNFVCTSEASSFRGIDLIPFQLDNVINTKMQCICVQKNGG